MGQVVSQFIADYGELLVEGVRDTIIMTAVATLLAYVIGLPVGVLLITSAKKGIRPNSPLKTGVGGIVNIGRSGPFIILLVAITPLTRLIVGTSLGVPGAIVPLVITFLVLEWVVGLLDQTLQILPIAWHPDRLLGVHIPGFGVILTLAILLVVGATVSNFIGKKLVQWGDALVSRIPVVRSIYSSVKQVSDTLFSESGNAFRTAVLVQWPREGVWTVAFITGSPAIEVACYLRDDYVSVFVPTTPNPTGGYFVLMRKSDCVELEMSVDVALKYIVSMGVVVPPAPVLDDQKR